jgi:hypothetical protein
MMLITANEAKKLTYKAMTARAEETAEKAETVLNKIESEILNAATSGRQEYCIELYSYMTKCDFPDLEMAKEYIAAEVRKNGFTAKWDTNYHYILIVKW